MGKITIKIHSRITSRFRSSGNSAFNLAQSNFKRLQADLLQNLNGQYDHLGIRFGIGGTDQLSADLKDLPFPSGMLLLVAEDVCGIAKAKRQNRTLHIGKLIEHEVLARIEI